MVVGVTDRFSWLLSYFRFVAVYLFNMPWWLYRGSIPLRVCGRKNLLLLLLCDGV